MAGITRVDERWLARCRAGDTAAWHRLVEDFRRLVYSIPKRGGLSDEDCADVFQATFITLYRELDRIQTPESLPKWLAVVAARETYRHQRHRDRNRPAGDYTLDALLADEEEGAENLSVAALEAEAVRAGLDALQEKCRRLLTYLYMEDRDYKSISAALAIPIGAIGPTRARCLQKLRDLLAKGGVFEEIEVSATTESRT